MVTLTIKEQKTISKTLSKSGIDLIANQFKVTSDYVRKIIKGKRNNEIIFDKVIELYKEMSNKQDEKNKKVKSLFKK